MDKIVAGKAKHELGVSDGTARKTSDNIIMSKEIKLWSYLWCVPSFMTNKGYYIKSGFCISEPAFSNKRQRLVGFSGTVGSGIFKLRRKMEH